MPYINLFRPAKKTKKEPENLAFMVSNLCDCPKCRAGEGPCEKSVEVAQKIDQIVIDMTGDDSVRTFSSRPYRNEMGRSSVIVTCPFCGTEVEAFIWSLAGSGKRCPQCKALHKWHSQSSTRYQKKK